MDFAHFEEIIIDTSDKSEIKEVVKFLDSQNLLLDKNVDKTVIFKDGKNIAATGSICGKSLRSIAVSPFYQGGGVINRLITKLIEIEYQNDNHHIFIFTKPQAKESFSYFGFNEIASSESAVLMEKGLPDISDYQKNLKKSFVDGKVISSIVMNCNPFTLGHLYLIEKTSKESDIVHIFIVEEDKSTFPSDIRLHLVKEGTKHLKNVYIHKGGDYIISSATFPSYFIKDADALVASHALIDIDLFGKYIAPSLKITKRYAGNEPYCKVTSIYNDVMERILPEHGIEFIKVDRKEIKGDIISASKVRALIKEGKINEAEKYLPESTWTFLNSNEAKAIIEKIKETISRH